jgi:LysM repeat protein
MSPWKIAALLAALPSAPLAQQANSLQAAKNVGQVQQAGVDRGARLVEPAFTDTAPAGGAAPAPAPAPEGGPVDLNRAASRLEGESQEVVSPDAPSRATPGGPAPETYTVKRGDTLWDLSSKFLDSPWYWPKLWSYNPEIANPNWIYPGNPIRFYPGGEQGPARIEPGPGAPPALIASEPLQAPRELDDLTRGTIDKAEVLDEEDSVAVVGPYKIARPRRDGPAVQRNSFVTARQLEEAGRIVAAFEEKMIMSDGDRIYARFRDPAQVKVGQKFSVYRTEGPLLHPRTGRPFGYKTLILGTARVTAVDPRTASSLVITYVNDGIERGDYLGPVSDQALKPVFVRPNRESVDAQIVGLQPSIITGAAEFNVVYLDKGRAEGVEAGNTFEIVRSGDPYNQPLDKPLNDPGLPREVIGDVIVFDTQEHASSAFVRRSLLDLLVGDIAEMRPQAAGGAPRPATGG